MGKLTSLNGKVTGKIGSIVYSTNAGQTIAREYNPNVSNPNTEAQVDQRAKLKLMSQLAASLAPVIAIPKEGLKSSRNLFIKKNMGACSANEGVAQITYENVQLTNGNAGIPAIHATRSAEAGVVVNLEERADAAISRVVYIMYTKTSEATLQYVQSIIVDTPSSNGKFPGSMLYCEGDLVLFAYGMKDLTAKASAKYSNLSVLNAEDIAKLSCSRKINYGDYQFTMTRGTTMFADENETAVVGDNEARVYVTASGPGSVSGAGVFALGSEVTVVATPQANAHFEGWRINGSDTIVSTDASYTFTLNGMTDLIAVFAANAVSPRYTVSVNSESEGAAEAGEVSGGGTVEAGQTVTVVATNPAEPTEGQIFQGWFWNGSGSARSTQMTYTFIPTSSGTMVARWGMPTGGDGNEN